MSQTQTSAVMDNHNLRDIETAKKYFDIGRAAEAACDRIGAIESYEAA